MKRIRVSVIGCGYWGVNYVRMFSELPTSTVAVVCDQQADRLEDIRHRFPEVEVTTEVEEAVRRDGVDVAIVCTPATTHYDIARLCLESGKHILVEKPITTNSSQARELVELARRHDLIVMVGHTFIHNGGIQKLKSYISEGQAGKLYYLYSRRTNLGPIRRDVNALWDLAPHDVAIFNHLLESVPQWASAVGVRVLQTARQDVGFVALGYPGGVVGHIHVSWADPNKVREIVVVGSDRRIVFDDLNALERVRVFEKGVKSEPEASSYGEHQFQVRDGDIISPKIDVSEPLKNQCSHFLDCVMLGRQPVADGQKGLEVVRVMEAVDRSAQMNGAPVPVEREND
ncbi:MAG: Gfo/Idh/MocA family protein [Chloroflexota bacterium]